MMRMTVTLCLVLLLMCACAATGAGAGAGARPRDPPRLLLTLQLKGEGAMFHLFDSDPRTQAASFCAQHGMTASDCAAITAEAEAQFFEHQWRLQSTQYVITETLPNGDAASVAVMFDLYSGPIGPVLQAHRFCHTHSLPPADCLPIAKAAQDMYYRQGRLLSATQLQLSSPHVSTPVPVIFSLFDNLAPAEQAHDLCRLHGIELSDCGEIVALAEEEFFPSVATVTLPATASAELEVEVKLYERADPALSALTACAKHNLSSSRCNQLLDMAESAYFAALYGGAHQLRQKYSFPGASFLYECHLYEGVDPTWQALRCCDRNQVSKVDCKPVLTAVHDLFYRGEQSGERGQTVVPGPVASFSLQLADEATPAELQLYSTLDPFTQVTYFCQSHAITLANCLGYMNAAEIAYHEAAGPLLVPITLQQPVESTFNLYVGRDPVLQAKRFCAQHHLLVTQCKSLVAHAFQQYVAGGNLLSTISIEGVAESLMLVDNLDPRYQVDYYCEKHGLSWDTCAEVVVFAEHKYFGAGDLIASIPLTIRNNSLVLQLYNQVDPLRQVKTFCERYRIAWEDCSSLRDFAKKTFQEAGKVVDVIRMFIPGGENGTSTEKNMECYDNLDPAIQAQNWCDAFFISASSCAPIVDIFETTYFRAGDVITTLEFADRPFSLHEHVDPFIQASRFCKRHQLSAKFCQPLIEYCEKTYYKFGSALKEYNMQTKGSDEVLSFTLYDRADPAVQVDRFCDRHKIPNCADLKSAAQDFFFEAGTILGTLQMETATTNETLTFTVYSNLDPAIQAQRVCVEHDLSEEVCEELIAAAEKLYFRAGEALSYFTFDASEGKERGSRNITFTLYNRVDPLRQLARFFHRHPRLVPPADRPQLTAAMIEKFYAAGTFMSSLNVTIEGVEDVVTLHLYDNLDPLVQTKNFCSLHTLSLPDCEEMIAAAEQIYFGVPMITHFRFSLDDKPYRFNYFDMDVTKQVERFCFLHEETLPSSSCSEVLRMVENQAREIQQKKEDDDRKESVPNSSDDIYIEL